MPTTLSVRHHGGEMLIELPEEAFIQRLRQELQITLPGVLCCPITDSRVEYLRSVGDTTPLFSIPYHHLGPIHVQSIESKSATSEEQPIVLHGIIKALHRTSTKLPDLPNRQSN